MFFLVPTAYVLVEKLEKKLIMPENYSTVITLLTPRQTDLHPNSLLNNKTNNSVKLLSIWVSGSGDVV